MAYSAAVMAARVIRAWWVTLLVLGSYLSLRLWARVRSDEWFREELRRRHIRNARRVQRAVVSLKGLFIKIGQLFSIMTNFLPDEFRRELEGLQDAIAPSGFGHVERRLREELGKHPDELFEHIERTPVASASLGQVHRARLADGRVVAVKVQHPDVDRIVRVDLRTMRGIVSIVGLVFPQRGLMTVYREVRAMILAELDFAEEGRNLERIARNFEGSSEVQLPRVVWELSSARVLTTDWVDGVKITNMAALEAAGVERRGLAVKLVHAWCKQIFEDGVYHADPHPGNILVTTDQRIALVDFGAVAELSPRMREGIIEFLNGVLAANTEKICGALHTMGFVDRGGSSDEVLTRVVELVHERVTRTVRVDSFHLKDVRIDPEEALDALVDLRRMDIGLRELGEAFHIPREWILLERTLLLLTGLCTALDDTLRPMTLIRPYVERLVLRDRDFTSFALETTREVGLQYLSLPGEVKRLVANVNRGRLDVRSRDVRDVGRAVRAVGQQLVWALLTVASVALLAVFRLHGDAQGEAVATWGAWGFGALLGVSLVRHRPRRR